MYDNSYTNVSQNASTSVSVRSVQKPKKTAKVDERRRKTQKDAERRNIY